MGRMTVAQVQATLGSNPPESHMRAENDFYRTGAVATNALLDAETFEGTVWECACGQGDMSEVMRERGLWVISTDMVDRNYGDGVRDFLNGDPVDCDHVVTNPPYTLAEEFVMRGLEIVPVGGKVAVLCRLAWLEGQGRRRRLFGPLPPIRVHAFSGRIPMARPPRDFQVGLIAFAWFVWEKGHTGATELRWI